MKKLFISIILLLSVCQFGNAQQDTHYTGYMFNSLVLNPAYAGSREVGSALAYYRHQWADISTAPRDFSFSIHSPFKTNSGIGFFAESDWIGVHNRLSAFASYSYRIKVGTSSQLSLGLQGGFLRYSSNFTELENLEDNGDFVFDTDQSRFLPNFGLGVFFYSNKGYIGLSVPHLLQSNIVELSDSSSASKLSPQERHYFLTAGTVLTLDKHLKIRPSVMLKAAPLSHAPISVDISLAFIIKNKVLLGAAHRFTDSFSFFLEYQINQQIRAGYAYDFPLREISDVVGSHEIFVGYEFGFEKEKIVTPRFF